MALLCFSTYEVRFFECVSAGAVCAVSAVVVAVLGAVESIRASCVVSQVCESVVVAVSVVVADFFAVGARSKECFGDKAMYSSHFCFVVSPQVDLKVSSALNNGSEYAFVDSLGGSIAVGDDSLEAFYLSLV